MKNIILTLTIGLIAASNSWAEETVNSQKMDKLVFPEFTDSTSLSKSMEKNPSKQLSQEEIIASHTVADCIMANSYPRRSGGIRLHKKLHPEHDKKYCQGN